MQPQPPQTAAQRYYQAHIEKRRAYGREYYKQNKEKILASNAKLREARAPPPPPPEPQNQQSPLEGYKRRGISNTSPAVVLFS